MTRSGAWRCNSSEIPARRAHELPRHLRWISQSEIPFGETTVRRRKSKGNQKKGCLGAILPGRA